MRLTTGIGHLQAIGALGVVPPQPKTQFIDGRLKLDLVGDAQVLEIPRAEEVVVQLQTLLAIVGLIG